MTAPSRARRNSAKPSVFLPAGAKASLAGESLPVGSGVTTTVLPLVTATTRATLGRDAARTRTSRCPTGTVLSRTFPSAPARPAVPPSTRILERGAAPTIQTLPYSVAPGLPACPARTRQTLRGSPGSRVRGHLQAQPAPRIPRLLRVGTSVGRSRGHGRAPFPRVRTPSAAVRSARARSRLPVRARDPLHLGPRPVWPTPPGSEMARAPRRTIRSEVRRLHSGWPHAPARNPPTLAVGPRRQCTRK